MRSQGIRGKRLNSSANSSWGELEARTVSSLAYNRCTMKKKPLFLYLLFSHVLFFSTYLKRIRTILSSLSSWVTLINFLDTCTTHRTGCKK